MEQLRVELIAALAEAGRLASLENPVSEPYKTRYEAREVLLSFRAKLTEAIAERAKVVKGDGSAPLDASVQVAMELGAPEGFEWGDMSAAQRSAAAACAELHAGVDRVDARLGINYIETEENAEGDRVLDTTLPRIVGRAWQAAQAVARGEGGAAARCGAAAMCADAARAANFLCLIWSGWGKHAAALGRLRAVKAAYNAVSRALKGAPRPAAAAAAAGGGTTAAASVDGDDSKEESKAGGGEEESASAEGGPADAHRACEPESEDWAGREAALVGSLEVAVTHTLFYATQVYTQLGRGDAAALHVERTLRRQVRDYTTAAESRKTKEAAAAAAEAAAATAPPASGAGGGGADAATAGSAGPARAGGAQGAAIASLLHAVEAESHGGGLDRVDWARNCLKLAGVHRARRRWGAAAHCVAAARAMTAEAQRAAEAEGWSPSNQAGGRAGGADGGAGDDGEEPVAAAVAAWTGDAASRLLGECRTAWGDLHRDLLKVARDREIGLATDTDQLGPAGEVGAEASASGGKARAARERTAAQDCFAEAAAAVALAMPCGLEAAKAGPSAAAAAAREARSAAEAGGGAAEAAVAAVVGPKGAAKHALEAVLAKAVGASRSEAAHQADPDDSGSDWEGDEEDGASGAERAAAAGAARRVRRPFEQFIARVRESVGSSPALLVPLVAESVVHEPPAITSFAPAREVFLVANAEYKVAVEIFVLDGFVTDHVGICASVSSLYSSLALWERSPKRACAMHQRRIAVAAPLLAALNPSVYIVAHKELGMELGQAAQEAMDLRVSAVEQRMEADGKPLTGRELLSMNLLADQALALYNHFLRCYDVEAQLEEAVAPAKKPEDSAAAAAAADRKVKHSPAAPTCIRTREAMIAAVAQGAVAKADPEIAKTGGYAGGDVSKPLMGATSLDDGTIEAFLTAHFCIARLLGKRIDPANRVRDAMESLMRYKWLLKYAPTILSKAPEGCFEREMAMCKEMVELLPQKISRMHYGGETFGMLG
ncbi:hypothetical protein FNF29_03771 [Cafeteria roenbergensis]|uniref:KIF-binding protein n=2 Tax=Cafeteria roenbergensis TaxID=33653 RepID=A0A5A8CJ87_CAFRO|nr:hypothetical protein FNF29_03771 [Cafeteria roenbergensis]|eukprot:KAA0152544.1 hypothetical protein FNF29_03771 [Cafeteria roenbergensis]